MRRTANPGVLVSTMKQVTPLRPSVLDELVTLYFIAPLLFFALAAPWARGHVRHGRERDRVRGRAGVVRPFF